jgi:MerR family transcriptional regulator, heat shock protein HspR
VPELRRARRVTLTSVPRRDDLNRPRYIISIAAELSSCHPRTLRIYEEEGLLRPQRRNNLRLYSEADIQRVRIIRFLTRRQGVNLAGVRVILQLEALGKVRVFDLFEEDDVRRRADNLDDAKAPEPENGPEIATVPRRAQAEGARDPSD